MLLSYITRRIRHPSDTSLVYAAGSEDCSSDALQTLRFQPTLTMLNLSQALTGDFYLSGIKTSSTTFSSMRRSKSLTPKVWSYRQLPHVKYFYKRSGGACGWWRVASFNFLHRFGSAEHWRLPGELKRSRENYGSCELCVTMTTLQ
jgi:hypothetical protein